MIQLLFTVRYQSQLRRVRPEVMSVLEAEVARSIRDSGGTLRIDGNTLRASFDENVLAFWLDLIVALEGISEALAAASKELYGYACLVRTDATGLDIRESALRELSRRDNPMGIWCDPYVSAALAPYASFGIRSTLASDDEASDVAPLSEFKLSRRASSHPADGIDGGLRATLKTLTGFDEQDAPKCFAFIGEFSREGRNALRAAVQAQLGAFPPYVARFGSGGVGLACLGDAIDPDVAQAAKAKDTRGAAAAVKVLGSIAAERLRADPPKALVREFSRYIAAFAESYAASARSRSVPAIFVLEDIHKADRQAMKIASALFCGLVSEKKASVILTSSRDEPLNQWKGCTIRTFRLTVPARGKAEDALFTLSDDLLEYVYALFLLGPLFDSKEVLSLFALEGKPSRALEHALTTLSAEGMLYAPDHPAVAVPILASILESKLGSKAERVRTFVKRRLLDAVATGKANPSFGLLTALASLGGECDDDLALDAVEAESGDGSIQELERVFASDRLRRVLGRRALPLKYIARAQCALRLSDEHAIRTVFAAPFPDWFPVARYRAQALEAFAAFSLGSSDIPNAEIRAKESILLLQNRNDSHGLARAYRLLGLVELAKERVSEAIDYLSFARESSEIAAEGEEAALDAAYASVAQFLWGNTAKAERLALNAENLAARSYRSDWERWARFFRGRLRFELGCYRDAVELFDSLLVLDDEGICPDERRTLASWSFRSRTYNGGTAFPGSGTIDEEGDGGLFLLESYFFSKNYSEAVALADRLLSRPISEAFASPEKPDWRSGFSMVEDLVLPTATARRRLIRMLRALSLSADAEDAVAAAEAAEMLRSLVKDEKLSESDPCDALYYRSYCQTLEASAAPPVDVGTALSVAFKRLQRRASRIDDAETKRCYLYLNRWNAALLADAKVHNLI